ncbi:hypothetical protein QBC39DRAFT_285918 [Podospora conica]|nr:hypothetical protein QBC39DRAFT_285918 [Schizothecium conicum]
MRFDILFLGLGLAGQAYAQTCGWFLNPDDCICMMSTTGGLLKDQTSYCCRAMGYKMTSNICGVDRINRQGFKDCCKGLNQESVIGHCR